MIAVVPRDTAKKVTKVFRRCLIILRLAIFKSVANISAHPVVGAFGLRYQLIWDRALKKQTMFLPYRLFSS